MARNVGLLRDVPTAMTHHMESLTAINWRKRIRIVLEAEANVELDLSDMCASSCLCRILVAELDLCALSCLCSIYDLFSFKFQRF